MMRAAVDRRHGGRRNGAPGARAPTAGRHADLLRLASSIGNRRMAQIARDPWPWYGPPMGVEEAEEEEDLTGLAAPPGLDLSFLDDPAPAVQPAAAPRAPSRINELDGLDAQNKIRSLVDKVEELLAAGACVVSIDGPYKLNGSTDTIEARFSVRERAGAAVKVQFVVHYHPFAEKADTKSHNASQWHIKKWANKEALRVDSYSLRPETHPRLLPLIPKFRDVKRDAKKLPDGRALYKPK